MPMWDKAALLKDRRAFIETCSGWSRRIVCGWWFRSQRMNRRDYSGAASARRWLPTRHPSILSRDTSHFEQEVLHAIEASSSDTEFESRVSRIVEEEPTPMVCGTCCPRGKPHRHDLNHAF